MSSREQRDGAAADSLAELVVIRIDESKCVGAGACMVHEPVRIEPGADGTAVVDPDATFVRDHAAEICADCPSGAISMHEIDR